MLNALNEVLRDDFIKDSVAGVNRWNKVLEKAGLPQRLVGAAQGVQPQDRRARRHPHLARGPSVSEEEWKARQAEWLPTPETSPSSPR
jgi:benzoyl-CoA 2,3-dioxygenase component B